MNRKRIVLLGIGHTNAHIVNQWATDPIAECDLICISKFPTATYSGMLPGTLGAQFRDDEMRIDLVALADRANAKLVIADVDGLDLDRGQLSFTDHAPVTFDALSIGVGSMPMGWQKHIASPALVPVKPMQTFLQRLTKRLQAVEAPERNESRQFNRAPTRVAVVGGGVASVEIAFCLLQQRQKQSPDSPISIEIFTSSDHVAEGMTSRSIHRIERMFAERGIELHHNHRVIEVHEKELVTDNGKHYPTDCVIWATGAAPVPVISKLGMKTDSRGFIATHKTLQTITDPRIFAVGDCGTVLESPAPKAGVYAVRQCPILWHNLRALIHGVPMQSFHPQSSFLKLLNTGDGKALLEYRFISIHAAWCWKLKTWIDKHFINEFTLTGMNR